MSDSELNGEWSRIYQKTLKKLIDDGMDDKEAKREATKVADSVWDSEEEEEDKKLKPMSPPRRRSNNTLGKSHSIQQQQRRGGAAAGSASTPSRKVKIITKRIISEMDSKLDAIADELKVYKADDEKIARSVRDQWLKSSENVTAIIQHIVEDSLNLTTPPYKSATLDMSNRSLVKGNINIYIAAYAWPDKQGAISTKKFLEDLIVSDNFGAFTAILQDTRRDDKHFDGDDRQEDDYIKREIEFNTQYRADPAFGHEHFLNMWLNDPKNSGKTEDDFTEEEFQTWFHLEHLYKLGMCWKQNARKREVSYRTIGELSLGIRRYFPIVYDIRWARWHTETPGREVDMPTQSSVANTIEEHLQRQFLNVVEVEESRKKKRAKKAAGPAAMLNEPDNVNRRFRKWEYIFNIELDEVAERVENELKKLTYDARSNPRPDIFTVDGVEIYIVSFDKLGEHERVQSNATKQLDYAGASQDSDGWESTQPLDDYSQELHKKIIKLRF